MSRSLLKWFSRVDDLISIADERQVFYSGASSAGRAAHSASPHSSSLRCGPSHPGEALAPFHYTPPRYHYVRATAPHSPGGLSLRSVLATTPFALRPLTCRGGCRFVPLRSSSLHYVALRPLTPRGGSRFVPLRSSSLHYVALRPLIAVAAPGRLPMCKHMWVRRCFTAFSPLEGHARCAR
jgi:hypothetical protein